jgi:O-antigen ligase
VPPRAVLAGAALLAAVGAWTALSILWSPAPALARDEALLVVTYALALLVPALVLTSRELQLAGLGLVGAGAATLALAVGVRLALSNDPLALYEEGRLAAPISYTNAQAAVFLIGFWPLVALAARRSLRPALRSAALAGAAATGAGWLLTQSKGGAIALVLSAVVVFALTRFRLRALVPSLVVAGLTAVAYRPLTAPYRAQDEAPAELVAAIQDAGLTLLGLAIAGAVLGAVYVVLDWRLDPAPRARRLAAAAVLGTVVAGLVAGVLLFLVRVDSPGDYLADRWDTFKSYSENPEGSSHLASIGSNRYDFWRVALGEFADHPLAGIGGRGFGAAYLVAGKSPETPARAHSVELDVLAETGIVGLLLLVAALAVPLAALVPRARRGLGAAAVVGGVAYWLVHATGDWTWTFPAAGIPAFLLLGVGLAGEGRASVRGRVALAGGAAALAVGLLAFAPPWLSGRLVDRIYEGRGSVASNVDWARRLDPLSVDPLLAEAGRLAGTPAALASLEEAVRKEPRSPALRYLLGTEYLAAGRAPDALRELRRARELAPRDEAIAAALSEAGG